MIHIRMTEALHLAQAHPAAVYDAGVVILINDGIVVRADQGRDNTKIDLHAGAEHQRGFLAHKISQPLLQLQMQP